MKWIKALDLALWAEALHSRDKMPGLVADLIRATASSIRHLRFPNDDMGQVRGFDGDLDVDAESQFVPDGQSIWEFGSGGSGKTKAEADYVKRTKQVTPELRAKTTLVIISPKTWDTPGSKLPDWLKEKNDLKEWQRVEYIDGTRLEDWLEECPAVAARWAKYELKLAPQHGAQSTQQFWDAFSSRFSPNLSESVLLAGREQVAAEFLAKLDRDEGRLAYAADSTDEVIAFAVAAIRMAPEKVRKTLESRAIIVESLDAVEYFLNKPNLIFLPRLEARGKIGLMERAGPTLISAGADDKRRGHESLPRPTARQLSKAFLDMGIPEDEGYERARRCGRSLSVLARRYGTGTSENPVWAEKAESLVPFLLAGAWVGSAGLDQAILSHLTTKAYQDAEDELRSFIKMPDAPVERYDNLWTMRASVDAFINLGHRIGRKHLHLFKQVVEMVFSKAAEQHKPPTADQPFPAYSGKGSGLAHSEYLKDGLMNTLLHMAVLHEEADFEPSDCSPEAFVRGIVDSLPGLSSDYRMMASLDNQLPLLAEAAPSSFLEALEHLLEGDKAGIRPIFEEHPGLLTPVTYHTGLLWALEILAWNPQLLRRVAHILAELAAIDPGGALGNRPINSLRGVFLSWTPGTAASTQHRLGVLESTIQTVPSIAWPLLSLLLPRYSDTNSPTAKPKFREYEYEETESLTYGLVWESETRIVSLALGIIGQDPERWKTLIEAMGAIPDAAFDEAVVLLESALEKAAPDERMEIWKCLNREVLHHQRYASTDWAMSAERTDKLTPIVAAFGPVSMIENKSWLFDDWTPAVDASYGTDLIRRVDAARLELLTDIRATRGVAGIVQLVKLAKLPRIVISTVSGLGLAQAELFEIYQALLASDLAERDLLAALVVAHGAKRFEMSWMCAVQESLQRGDFEPDRIARVLGMLDDEVNDWEYVASFGSEVEQAYWKLKFPIPLEGDRSKLIYAVGKYTEAQRAAAALTIIARELPKITTEEIIRLLISAVAEQNNGADSDPAFRFFDIDEVFNELAGRDDITPEQLAGLEFRYFAVLRSKSLTIYKLMLTRPNLFMEMVCKAFKARSDEPKDISETERLQACTAYKLLKGLETLPGQAEQEVDAETLLDWCAEVRRLAKESDREDVAEQLIGQILAHSPLSSRDKAWPHEAVRRAIESLSSDAIERGICIERFNMRGVVSKAMDEGGDQERALARQSSDWANIVSSSVRTSTMLRRIAQSWEEDAKRADIDAAQRTTRW